jgi:hypothetical protein
MIRQVSMHKCDRQKAPPSAYQPDYDAYPMRILGKMHRGLIDRTALCMTAGFQQ